MNLNKHFLTPVAVSSFFGLLAAYFSVGYFQLDEHYQILEFLSFKLDPSNRSSLPWEFDAQIRPWLQPFLYYYLTKFLNIFGVFDPFVLEKIFRLISVIVFQVCIWKMYSFFILTDIQDETQKKYLKWFYALFWVFPFLSARISSEAFGASLFFIGFIGLHKNLDSIKKIDLQVLFYSFLIGISVWIRFQLAAAVLGLLCWYIFFKKPFKPNVFAQIAAGGFIAVIVGVLVDYWGYGNFALTPINYFSRNILQGEAAKHGISPWWDYFDMSQKKLHPGFGAIVVLSFLYFWIKQFKHYLVLPSLLFYLLHMFTAHKELRFIFPLVYLIPFVLIFSLKDLGFFEKIKQKWRNFATLIFVVYFVCGSFASATKSPYQGINLLRHLKESKINKIYTFSSIPMQKLTHNIMQSYYGKLNVDETLINKIDLLRGKGEVLVAARGGREALLLRDQKCIEVYPRHNFIYFWMHYSRKFFKQDYYSIHQCELK